MNRRAIGFASLSFLLLWTTTAMATPKPKEQALKVGKRGEITLTKPTQVDGKTLQPDTYVIQHRVAKDGTHFVRFLELKKMNASTPNWPPGYTYTEQDNEGEIQCRVIPAPGTIKETTAYIVTENGVPRITKVTIKGENVYHVF